MWPSRYGCYPEALGLLDAIRRAQGAVRRPRQEDRPSLDADGKRFLLVYLFPRLGDALLFLPAVNALCRHAKAAKVDLLLSPLGARVAKTVALGDRHFVLSNDTDLTALEEKLELRRYDYAIDLTHRGDVDARSWLSRSGARFIAGFIDDDEDPRDLGYIYGTRDDRVETHTHWSRFCVEPLRAFSVEAPDFDLPFAIHEREREAASAAFGASPRLLLVPGGQDADKCWPKERFIAIGRAFLENHGGSVVVSGAPWERALVKDVARGIGPKVVVFSGRSLNRLAALVLASDVVLGNDTGPVHYGFFMQKRVFSIFSRMSPEVWGAPYPDPRFAVLRAHESLDPSENERWSMLAIDRLNALMAGWAG